MKGSDSVEAEDHTQDVEAQEFVATLGYTRQSILKRSNGQTWIAVSVDDDQQRLLTISERLAGMSAVRRAHQRLDVIRNGEASHWTPNYLAGGWRDERVWVLYDVADPASLESLRGGGECARVVIKALLEAPGKPPQHFSPPHLIYSRATSRLYVLPYFAKDDEDYAAAWIFGTDPIRSSRRPRFRLGSDESTYPVAAITTLSWALGCEVPSMDAIVNARRIQDEWATTLPDTLSAPLFETLSEVLKKPEVHSSDAHRLFVVSSQAPEFSFTREMMESLSQSITRASSDDDHDDDFDFLGHDFDEPKRERQGQESELAELLPAGIRAVDIFEELNGRVIGQVDAKKQLATLFAMHLSWFQSQDRRHRASNALAIGSTGVGKTHTLRVAAEYLRIPFVVVDSTSLVPSGIVGLQIEDVLQDLVVEAGRILKDADKDVALDVKLAERGVILIDEIDKIRRSEHKDEFGKEHVQRRLLKLTEGATLPLSVSSHTGRGRDARVIDTSGILLIASGAFEGIDSPKVRNERPTVLQRSLNVVESVIPADVINYGFLPELVARLQTIINFNPLTTDDLRGILANQSVSPLGAWEAYFETLEKRVIFEDDAQQAVAHHAQLLGLGARGLQQVLFPLLAGRAFDFSTSGEKEWIINAQAVKEALNLK